MAGGAADKRGPHIPERRCVACGKRAPQGELVRFYARPEGSGWHVVPDEGARRGRGAYLCRRLACLDLALRRRAFARSFRRAVRVEEQELQAALTRDDR